MSTSTVVNMEIPQSNRLVCMGSTSTFYASNALFVHFYFPEIEREIIIRYISGSMTLDDIIQLLNTKFGLGLEINQKDYKFSFDPEFFTEVSKLSCHLQELNSYQFMDKIANRRIYVRTRRQGDISTNTFFCRQAHNYISISSKDSSSVERYFMVQTLDTVYTLKKHLIELYGVPIDNQRVIFNGKELIDDRTMEDSGIVKGSCVQLFVRHRAGPYDWTYQKPESNPRITIYNHESESFVQE